MDHVTLPPLINKCPFQNPEKKCMHIIRLNLFKVIFPFAYTII